MSTPSAPNITYAPITGDTTLTFEWTAPDSDGGSEITGYVLSNQDEVYELQIDDSPWTVSGLTNGSPYTFQILATNSNGEGDSATYNEATPVEVTVPDIPYITIDPTVGNTTLTFYWSAPDSDGGSEIISYTLYDVNTSFELQLNESPYKLTLLIYWNVVV